MKDEINMKEEGEKLRFTKDILYRYNFDEF